MERLSLGSHTKNVSPFDWESDASQYDNNVLLNLHQVQYEILTTRRKFLALGPKASFRKDDGLTSTKMHIEHARLDRKIMRLFNVNKHFYS